MNRRASIITAILVLVLLGVGAWLSMRQAPLAQSSTAVVNNVAYDVQVEVPEQLTAGKESTVRIQVEKDSKPFDVNEEGRLLHIMIVSANLRDTFHTYSPTQEKVGVYSVKHTFTQPGQYRVWTEVDDTASPERHDQHAEQIAYAELLVGGIAETDSSLVESTETTIGSYQVRLIAPRVQAGKPATLRVEVQDASGKLVPLFSHEPFLYFMSGEKFSFFRHGHGVTLPDGSAGLENTFPHAGKYVWWLNLHLMRGDTVEEIQVPFILSVSK